MRQGFICTPAKVRTPTTIDFVPEFISILLLEFNLWELRVLSYLDWRLIARWTHVDTYSLAWAISIEEYTKEPTPFASFPCCFNFSGSFGSTAEPSKTNTPNRNSLTLLWFKMNAKFKKDAIHDPMYRPVSVCPSTWLLRNLSYSQKLLWLALSFTSTKNEQVISFSFEFSGPVFCTCTQFNFFYAYARRRHRLHQLRSGSSKMERTVYGRFSLEEKRWLR